MEEIVIEGFPLFLRPRVLAVLSMFQSGCSIDAISQGSLSATHTQMAGCSEPIREACRWEVEEVLAVLLGKFLTTKEAFLVSCLKYTDEEASEAAKDGKALHWSRACKLAEVLGADAHKVLSLLSANTHTPMQGTGLVHSYHTRLYSYSGSSNVLSWTSLISGETSSCRLSQQIDYGRSWVELPDNSLLFTGGLWERRSLSHAASVNVSRDFAVLSRHSMSTARYGHCSLYVRSFVYVVSGHVPQCERFRLHKESWEALPDIPTTVKFGSAITLKDSIYIVGGYTSIIQALHLPTFQWRVLSVQLPKKTYLAPCFRFPGVQDSFFIVTANRLYNLAPDLPELTLKATDIPDIQSWYAASYYVAGTLYTANSYGPPNATQLPVSPS
jgi:hypothetical protein